MSSEQYDLVILGGGLAGLSAGNRARQLGLSVAIAEQGDGMQYPCNSRFSGGILHLAFRNVKDDPQVILAAMRESNGGYGDEAVLSKLAHSSSAAVDWLEVEGTRFIRMSDVSWQQWMFAPPRPITPGLDWNGRGPDVTLRRLYDNYRGRGGQVIHRATGVELVVEDGACRGLVVEIDGQRQVLRSRAVLIADGGFQSNLELLRNITPAPSKLLQRGAANARGAGLQMAQALGAEVSDLSTFYGHLLAQDALSNPKLWPYPQLDELATAGIVVTSSGERFTDEGLGGVNIANRIAHRDDPLDCFVVFDSRIWETAGRNARIPANPHLVAAGARFMEGATVEELALAMGVPADRFRARVDAYNAALAGIVGGASGPNDSNGVSHASDALESLSPPRSRHKHAPMPIASAPFYALPIVVGITHTTGGLRIDERARVRRKGGGVVDGLYAAGSALGGIEGGPNAGYVGGLMKALVFGLLAAEDVAKERVESTQTTAASIAPSAAPTAAASTAAPSIAASMAQPGKPRYAAVAWLVKYGHRLALGLAAAPLLGAIALFASGHWIWAIVAVLAAPVVYVLTKSYAELVTLMSDMLIPK